MTTYPSHPLIALLTLILVVAPASISIANFRRRAAAAAGAGEPFVFGRILRVWYVSQLDPIEERLLVWRVTPSTLTYAQLFGGVVVAMLFAYGDIFTGGWILLMSGTCDILDGRLARRLGVAHQRGAFLDSVIDRYVDGIVFIGLAVLFRDTPWMLVTNLAALLGTQMISYSRARAEGLGIDCNIGWLQRPERYVILGFGSIFGSIFAHVAGPLAFAARFFLFQFVLVAMAVLVNWTALQRMVWVWRQLDREAT